MREPIKQLIADLDATAREYEADSKKASNTVESIRLLAKATATWRAVTRIYAHLAPKNALETLETPKI